MSRKTLSQSDSQMVIGASAVVTMCISTGVTILIAAFKIGFWASMAAGFGACLISSPFGFGIGLLICYVHDVITRQSNESL